MFCTKCGFEIKDGYKFCPKCGTPAFIEKEKPMSEVKKEEVDEVAKETNASSAVSEHVVKSKDKIKKPAKANTASKPKKKETDTIHDDFIPNPMIEKELDIEDWKVMAEEGNEDAILILAFRYEIGIGIEKDVEKAKELYTRANQRYITCDTHICDIITKHLCVTKEQREQFFKDKL